MSLVKATTFAIVKAEISLNGNTNTPATWTEIPLAADGTINYTMSKSEVTDGEGNLFQTWRHSPRATVALRTKVAFPRLMEMISSSPVSSAQSADLIYFGRTEELDPNNVRLRLQCRAKNYDTGADGYAEAIVFNAQGGMAPFSMGETKQGEFAFEFDSNKSSYDASGNSIPAAYGSFHVIKSTLS